MKHPFAVAGLVLALASGTRASALQDTPQEIAKADLPKKVVCVVCEANGASHEMEKPVAGVRYKGASYYFCNAKEVDEFKKDPEGFMPPVLPRPATAFTLPTLSGEKRSLADFKGKVVLVDYWATWCVPCVAAMPDLQKLHDKLFDKGFSVVGISIDEEGAKKVKPFIEKKKFSYPILLDNEKSSPVWQTYHVRVMPSLFLIDQQGQIVRQWSGKVDKTEIEKAVTVLLK